MWDGGPTVRRFFTSLPQERKKKDGIPTSAALAPFCVAMGRSFSSQALQRGFLDHEWVCVLNCLSPLCC